MSIAEKLQASKDALDALLTYANEATQAGDADIGEAIRTLVDGYGKGGGGLEMASGTITPPTDNSWLTVTDVPFTPKKAFACLTDLSKATDGKAKMVWFLFDVDLRVFIKQNTLANGTGFGSVSPTVITTAPVNADGTSTSRMLKFNSAAYAPFLLEHGFGFVNNIAFAGGYELTWWAIG